MPLAGPKTYLGIRRKRMRILSFFRCQVQKNVRALLNSLKVMIRSSARGRGPLLLGIGAIRGYLPTYNRSTENIHTPCILAKCSKLPLFHTWYIEIRILIFELRFHFIQGSSETPKKNRCFCKTHRTMTVVCECRTLLKRGNTLLHSVVVKNYCSYSIDFV